jgi:acetolactate synthase I/II/III large subunit
VIGQAMAIDDRPVVIDFVVGADAQVWPMVAAGTGNDQIMAARDIRPLFEGDELVADISVESEVAAKAQEARQ